MRQRVRRRDGNRCRVCGASGSDGARLSVHHVVPTWRGGTDNYENLILLCAKHHREADVAARKQARSEPAPTPAADYHDDPASNIYWGPPSVPGGKPLRWSRHWFDWRPEELQR
jgi:hypothetical protein